MMMRFQNSVAIITRGSAATELLAGNARDAAARMFRAITSPITVEI